MFDDSHEAIQRYATLFPPADVDLFCFRRHRLDLDLGQALVALRPDLIILDLVLGESRQDGYRLIAELHKVHFVGDIPPLIVCSKLITDTPMGHAERQRAMDQSGVVAAFGKFPDLPSANKFLQYRRHQ